MMRGFGLRLASTSTMRFNSMMSGNCVSYLLVARLSVVAGSIALRRTLMAQLRSIGLDWWHRDSPKSPILITPRPLLLVLNLRLCERCSLWLLLRIWRCSSGSLGELESNQGHTEVCRLSLDDGKSCYYERELT